jgi:hypothetical protein
MKTSRKPLPEPQAAAVLTQAVVRAARLLSLSNGELGQLLGLSESSVSRLLAGTREIDPSSKEGELGLLMVRLYRSLDALVGGDAEQRTRWLRSSNRALNGTPVELILTATGLVNTVAYLDTARARL